MERASQCVRKGLCVTNISVPLLDSSTYYFVHSGRNVCYIKNYLAYLACQAGMKIGIDYNQEPAEGNYSFLR